MYTFISLGIFIFVTYGLPYILSPVKRAERRVRRGAKSARKRFEAKPRISVSSAEVQGLPQETNWLVERSASKGPVIIIGSAESEGLSADVRRELADILPQFDSNDDGASQKKLKASRKD